MKMKFEDAFLRFSIAIVVLICDKVVSSDGSRVLELSDRFLDVRHESQWFIKFYAPWCAYCKKMEPVWAQVAQALTNTNIRVGKVDCTRFTAVARTFNIQSYPTILYIKDDKEYVFNGDRTKEELLQFVIRMSGPAVQQVTIPDSVDLLKENNLVFFIFVGPHGNQLSDSYLSVAASYQAHAAFYATSPEIAKIHFEIDLVPAIIAYKEKNHIYFPLSGNYNDVTADHLNTSLHRWVNEERFPVFPKVTRSNINELMSTKKFLVLAIVEENRLSEIASHEIEFRDLVQHLTTRSSRDWQMRNKFQFGWIGNPELAHSIAMDYLPTPHLIVLNCTTNEHHIPDDDPLQMTIEAIQIFLEHVHNQTAPSRGGNAFHIRLYRSYFEARRSLVEMWRGNPILTAVLFGLPLGFLSLILYSICCADIMDADEDNEAEENHEKRE